MKNIERKHWLSKLSFPLMIRSFKKNVNREEQSQQVPLHSRLFVCFVFSPETFWSDLPETFLKSLLELFHTSATKMISKVTHDYRQKKVMDTTLHKSVQVLQMLYKVNILYLKYGMNE